MQLHEFKYYIGKHKTDPENVNQDGLPRPSTQYLISIY